MCQLCISEYGQVAQVKAISSSLFDILLRCLPWIELQYSYSKPSVLRMTPGHSSLGSKSAGIPLHGLAAGDEFAPHSVTGI